MDDDEAAEVGPIVRLKARLFEKLPSGCLVRVFAVLEVAAGKHEPNSASPVAILSIGDDAAVGCFREDAGKGRHLELVVVWDAPPVWEFDGLDPHLQERRGIEDVATAEDEASAASRLLGNDRARVPERQRAKA
jgi:hypothetical protein